MLGLKNHMITHEEKKPCPECGANVRHMKLHMLTKHTPDEQKKLQCKDCGKGFQDQHKLKVHSVNVHLKTRPYKCRYGCTFAYNDNGNRNAHERKTHGKIFMNRREGKKRQIIT